MCKDEVGIIHTNGGDIHIKECKMIDYYFADDVIKYRKLGSTYKNSDFDIIKVTNIDSITYKSCYCADIDNENLSSWNVPIKRL